MNLPKSQQKSVSFPTFFGFLFGYWVDFMGLVFWLGSEKAGGRLMARSPLFPCAPLN